VGTPSEATRVPRPRRDASAAESTPPRRLALFLRARDSNTVARLLDGLAGPWATAARHALRECEAVSSSERHGTLALQFGERQDAVARLRALVSEAAPALRCAIAQALPPHQQALFPSVSARARAAGPATPGLARLASRLVREALR